MTTTPAGGTSDLKSYDVPDPPRPGGWVLKCLLAAGVGLLAAAGVIRALRVSHLFWVAEHHVGGWRNENRIGSVQRTALRWLEKYDADTLRPHVLDVEDPKVRGYFHAILATTGDASQQDAMLAYLRAVDSGSTLEAEMPKVVTSMLALDKEQAVGRLLACYDDPGPVQTEKKQFSRTIAEATQELAPPEALLPHVLKMKEPERRGRFHAALALTKDAAQVDAVVAYARTVMPTNPGADRPKEWTSIVTSLGKFGPVATPKLQAMLEQTDSRALVSLAAEALRTSDLPFLVKHCRALLDEYDAAVPQLARDMALITAVEEGNRPADFTDADVAQARDRLTQASAKAYMIFEMLRAMVEVKDDQAVDFCIVRGLSTFDREIAEWSAMQIKARFTPEKLIDTLFSYIAQKTQFAVAEVEVYEGLMKELGPAGATRVAANLDRLIVEAEDDPEQVFWLYKKMGFTLLRELGDQRTISTLKKYAADPGSYVLTSTSTDQFGRRSRSEEEVKYADEVRKAIAAIEARGE